jgi:hypothetical protein
MAFNQGTPTVPTLINSSNVFIFGNTSSGNALSVQQLGAGNVFSFSNASGGSNVLVMNNLGRIGIGTTNPTEVGQPGSLLHIYDGTGNNPTMTVDASGSTGQARIRLKAGQAPSTFRANRLDYYSNTNIIWTQITDYNQNGTNEMNFHSLGKGYASGGVLTLTQAGNVGIGTTNPQRLFHVYTGVSGNVAAFVSTGGGGSYANVDITSYLNASNVPTNRISVIDGGDYSGHFTFLTKTPASENNVLNERMRITSAGNVGIGTPSPGALLDVYGGLIRNYINGDSVIISECTNGTNYAYYQLRVNTSGTPLYTFLTLKNSGQFWVCANNGYTTGVYLVQNGTSWTSSSDARLKNIIEPISNAISKVEQINPCIYSLKSDETNTRRVGVIAQDVYKVLPEAVDSTPDSDQMMGVQYTSLVPLALAAIKELSAQNKVLEQSLATATTNVSSLEDRLAALEAKLNSQ